ncbi:hypothetical protein [Bacteroides sp. 224]|nr:hypothetical protein [Bacteroides sp. 224]
MSTNENILTDISAELEKEFGAHGTPSREQFDKEAYAFYTEQIQNGTRED